MPTKIVAFFTWLAIFAICASPDIHGCTADIMSHRYLFIFSKTDLEVTYLSSDIWTPQAYCAGPHMQTMYMASRGLFVLGQDGLGQKDGSKSASARHRRGVS